MVWQTVPFFKKEYVKELTLANLLLQNSIGNSHPSLGHLDQTLSCSIPPQIGILFDAELCSSLAIYIILHMTFCVVFDRE